MLKPLSQLNYFFRLAAERKLSGSDQLMYLHIFNKFNQAHWTETLRISDTELKELMRLYDSTGKPATIETIRRSRQRLKAKGFIEFTSGNGQSPLYKLPCLYPDNTPDNTPADTLDEGLKSSTLLRSEDIRLKDSKDLNPYIQSRARNIESNLGDKSKTEKGLGDEEIDSLVEYWEQAGGAKLNFIIISELKALLQQHSLSLLKGAVKEASLGNNSKYGFSLNYLKLKLAEMQKGSGNVGKQFDCDEEPDYGWINSNS